MSTTSPSNRPAPELSNLDTSAPSAGNLSLAREIERLANQMFGSGPQQVAPQPNQTFGNAPQQVPPVPPQRVAPSALNVGAGGASPSVMLPPVPGAVKDPPITNAPPPRESDMRNVVSIYSENAHGTSAVPLLTRAETPSSNEPYYLASAGLPVRGTPMHTTGTPTPGGGLGPSQVASVPSQPQSPSSPTQGFGQPYFMPSTAPNSFDQDPARSIPVPDNSTAPSYESRETRTGVLANDPASSLRVPRDTYHAPAQTQHPGHRQGHEHKLPNATHYEQQPTPSDYYSERSGLRYDVPEYGLHHDGPENQAKRLPSYDSSAEGYVPSLSYVRDVQAEKPAPRAFDPYAIKRDFPILNERVHGKRLVWLDNAATTQKPQSVIDRLSAFYEHENSNIHRAAHTLAARATDAYEGAREKVARFLNAGSSKEIVFTRGTTEAINLVAKSWGGRHLSAGDEVVITWLEHHANIVPWQMICAEKGAKLRVAPVDDSGQVILTEYAKLLNRRTKMVSITQVSNALGTITPAAAMVQMAKAVGATTLVDGAQAVSHMRADVQSLGCDFYVFSGHKVFGPTGIGALYGTPEALEATPPWQGGGNMIADVTFEKTLFNPPPFRFEAGTGNIADAVGLGAAIDYVESIGIENVTAYEHALLEYGTHKLTQIPGLRMIGTATEKAGVMSFVVEGLNTEKMGGELDRSGIAVRSGHHCAQPILRRFGVEHTVRASLAPYNTTEDLDALVDAVRRLVERTRRRY